MLRGTNFLQDQSSHDSHEADVLKEHKPGPRIIRSYPYRLRPGTTLTLEVQHGIRQPDPKDVRRVSERP